MSILPIIPINIVKIGIGAKRKTDRMILRFRSHVFVFVRKGFRLSEFAIGWQAAPKIRGCL
jgi:hypothetical protein